MASSSTNKQPLLVDRPLHEVVVLGAVDGLTTPGNLAALNPGGLQILVPATEDGAIIDSLSIINNEANTTASSVVFFLSSESVTLAVNAQNTVAVAIAAIASTVVGTRTHVDLPPVLVPLPDLGATVVSANVQKKNTALIIPADKTLMVGLTTRLLLPTPSTTVGVFAQGGYY
jgi:hypothetical protein